MTIFYHGISTNIAKVESRGKIYFHYAETKRIYARSSNIAKIKLVVYFAEVTEKKVMLQPNMKPEIPLKGRERTTKIARRAFVASTRRQFSRLERVSLSKKRVAKIYFYGHPPLPDTKNQYASSRTDSGMDVRT